MNTENMNEIRVLSPTAILGYGFPEESFIEGMRRKPHVFHEAVPDRRKARSGFGRKELDVRNAGTGCMAPEPYDR